MALSKQAKTLSDAQQRAALNHVKQNRYPMRDKVILLLSFKAGLRAKEIAGLPWSAVTDSESNVARVITITNDNSKGKSGGREIPMHKDVRDALLELRAAYPDKQYVIFSDKGARLSAAAVCNWFWTLYQTLGFSGASSHSGRRTFITRAARKITEAGGSLRDVQDLAGHSSVATTQRYIEISGTAKRKVVDLI